MGVELMIDAVIEGWPAGWFSPTYKLLVEVWRDMVEAVRPITTRRNQTERRIELKTGGVIEMWSLDTPDPGRGRKYARVVIDEAAMAPNLEQAWNAAIRPTLTDYKGDGWFLSTPKGHNAFWRLFNLMGSDWDWASWQMPTVSNPFIDPDEVESARRLLPERIFAQEYLAQFMDDAGGVFRHVMDAATAREQEKPIQGHEYLFGVDWGKHNDFTVFTVIDITDNAVVYLDRFNQIDYTLQRGRLEALYNRFHPHTIIAERNSIGDPAIEELQRAGLPIQAFTTTNASKAQAIDALALAFEQGTIRILNDPVLVSELQAYEMERLPSGMLRYNAPPGMNDDCVMSLALAWHGVANAPWLLW